MDKIILITGANQGIGLAMAKLLIQRAPEYRKIIFTARNEERGLRAVESLNCPERLDFQVLDVTDLQQVRQVVAYVRTTYGKLDVLVNNAGAGWHSGSEPLNAIRPYLSVNFYGVKNVTEEFLDLVTNDGHIINLSSVLSLPEHVKDERLSRFLCNPELSTQSLLEKVREFEGLGGDWREKGWKLEGSGVYGISKAFVNAYSMILHRDLAAGNRCIKVNAVHPGWVRTTLGGSKAPLEPEQGAEIPLSLLFLHSGVSGKYWSSDKCLDLTNLV